MTTEFFSVIIVIGAIIVWFARRQLIKARQEEISNNPEALKADTGRLRDELEQSADEIIDRMAKHIDRLEGLIKEADRKAKILQDRIDYLEASGGRKKDEGDDPDAAFSAILEESIYQENMRPRWEAEATAAQMLDGLGIPVALHEKKMSEISYRSVLDILVILS